MENLREIHVERPVLPRIRKYFSSKHSSKSGQADARCEQTTLANPLHRDYSNRFRRKQIRGVGRVCPRETICADPPAGSTLGPVRFDRLFGGGGGRSPHVRRKFRFLPPYLLCPRLPCCFSALSREQGNRLDR